jgi:DNA helicase HerA-like ATPase
MPPPDNAPAPLLVPGRGEPRIERYVPQSLADLKAAAPDRRDWLWQGYLAPGNVTLLTSLWKSGKSTLISVLLARMKAGGTVAGLPMRPGRAVVISEESPEMWLDRSRVVDLDGHVDWFCRPFRGKRGSGKSYTLGTLLEGLCTKERGTSIAQNCRENSVLLFDTLGIFQWTDILLQEDSGQEIVRQQFALRRGWDIKPEPLDVCVWIPKGLRTPTTPAGQQEFSINCSDFSAADWGYLFGLDIYQDRMGQLLNDAYIKVTSEGWADTNRRYLAREVYSLDDLINCVKLDAEVKESYQAETRRAVPQQLQTYRRNPLFEDQGTPLHDFLRPGRMSVIVMNKMSDELRLIVVSAFLRRLIASRVGASETEKHLKILEGIPPENRQAWQDALHQAVPPTWVAIDEAQNNLPAERRTSATDVLIKYVREGRNYGLSFMVATQQPTSIDQRILAQVDTIICHKLTVQGDIDYVRRNVKSNLPEEVKFGNSVLGFDELLRSLDVGQALVSNTETERAFLMDVRPRISVHGGF